MILDSVVMPLRSGLGGALLRTRNRHFFLFDLIVFLTMPTVALFLRVDDAGSLGRYTAALVAYTLMATVIRVTVFFAMGLYRRYWRYASIEDLVQIGGAVFLSSLLVLLGYVILRAWPDLELSLPRSVPIMDSLLVALAVSAARFSLRLADRWRTQQPAQRAKRVGIMGAGVSGTMILREMRRNPDLGLLPVCFFDDDQEKQHVKIHGISVLGGRQAISRVVQENKLNLIILAMPTASGRAIRQITEICQSAGVQTKTIPGVFELLDGRVSIRQLRNVELVDLLRRSPIQTDTTNVHNLLRGKRVLITGGGGSIGRELCRQILMCNPTQLVLLGHGENSIFESERELRRIKDAQEALETEIVPIIADIRFADRIAAIFQEVRPEVVFHAAAHKHVPLMEMNPTEAVSNNILGTQSVVQASTTVGVERFVMISTDKAVNPTNIMGASKRAAEMVVLDAARRHGLPYVAVRFGNVLGSRGSVVPIFQRQIEAGGPVTVTHPDIQRYFMTIPEAVQLVLQAAVLGANGEIFVLDMGKPVKIAEMAKALIRLSGHEVDQDIEVVYTGLRPGEKLFEELFLPDEVYDKTAHAKIFTAHNAAAQLPDGLQDAVDALAASARRGDRSAIVNTLCALIPEYRPGATPLLAHGGAPTVPPAPEHQTLGTAVGEGGAA